MCDMKSDIKGKFDAENGILLLIMIMHPLVDQVIIAMSSIGKKTLKELNLPAAITNKIYFESQISCITNISQIILYKKETK